MLSLFIVNCQVAGKNPDDMEIPVIKPTTSPSNCKNDLYPVDAPQLNAVKSDQYLTQETSINDKNGNPISMKFYDVVEGNGALATVNDLVTVHYAGWLDDGCLFDSSYLRGQPSRFLLIQVIPGWTETLKTMKQGTRRRVEIPSDLAYGKFGNPPVIPPEATLTFDIKLIDVLTPDQASATATAISEK